MLTFINDFFSHSSPSYLLTEGLAIVALIFNLIAYRQNSMKRYRFYSGVAMLLLASHFYWLEAYAASIGCGLAVIRNIVSLRYNGWGVTTLFIAINFIALSIEWFYLQHHSIILLAYTASIIFTIGTLRFTDTDLLRKVFFVAETLSLVYATTVGSIFGTIYSLFNLMIILYWWINHYKK